MYDFKRRWPGVWLNSSTKKGDYVNTGNFLIKRHPYAMRFMDFWIDAADSVPELQTFRHDFPWEQRVVNAVVRSRCRQTGTIWGYICGSAILWNYCRPPCECVDSPAHGRIFMVIAWPFGFEASACHTDTFAGLHIRARLNWPVHECPMPRPV